MYPTRPYPNGSGFTWPIKQQVRVQVFIKKPEAGLGWVQVLGIPNPNPTRIYIKHIIFFLKILSSQYKYIFLSNPNLTSLFASPSLFTLTQPHSHSHCHSQSQPPSQPNSSSPSTPHIVPLPFTPPTSLFPFILYLFTFLFLVLFLSYCKNIQDFVL